MNGIRTDAHALPYEDRAVTFIRWLPGRKLDACDDRATKREWLTLGESLFAAWTGRYTSDIFVVDRAAARRCLKM